ncbi:MAG TPA: histidine kinase dimerization/phospho-acceptor domain-containing protein, partial [Elusimicrobiota bacterium]|nr:histidine kinase dimerization/phospho-acceptor domain-containing protein [Elusimicrobiota bacterium]
MRVFGVFAAGIIIPSCFLSYLGFRSLQVENILERKETEERYAAVADLLQHKVNDIIESALQEFRKDVRSSVRAGNPAQQAQSLLGISTIGSAPVHALVLMDARRRIVFPSRDEATRTPAPRTDARVDWGPLTREMARLERLEFVSKNIAAAVAGYEAALPRAADAPARIALLKAVAGADRKLKRYTGAEARYLELINRYDDIRDADGYPVGAVARQMLAEVYDASAQPERAVEARLDLAQGLLLGRWPIPEQDRRDLLNEIKPEIDKGLSAGAVGITEARARWLRLQALDEKLARARASADAFLKSSWPDTERKWKARGGSEEAVFRLGSGQMILVQPVENYSDREPSNLALAVVDEQPLIRAIEQAAADLEKTSGVRIDWNTLPRPPTRGLDKLTGMLRPYLRRSIAWVDPPMEFRLLENSSQPQETLRRRRQWIFFGMIALSLLVIIVGLKIMAQAIRREIEVANLKADFVANISHELRTPLSAISYIGERLSLGRYRSPEEVREFYDMLGEETGRLRELIEDVLDFSKMLDGRKAYPLAADDLASVGHEALE